jgi:hypothetical protein
MLKKKPQQKQHTDHERLLVGDAARAPAAGSCLSGEGSRLRAKGAAAAESDYLLR